MAFSQEPLEGKGVLYSARGVVDGAEMLSGALADARAAAERGELEYALVDFTLVTELRVTPVDVRRAIEKDERLARIAPHVILALVAPTDHVFGMARMYQTLAEDTGWTIQVFRRRRDAEDWIADLRTARRLPETP